MQLTLIAGAPRRADHLIVERILKGCETESGGSGMHVGVCNESGKVYLEVSTANDEEFIAVISCLQALGFAEVSQDCATSGSLQTIMASSAGVRTA